MPDNIIEIHTSDRQTYKRCRRRFDWGSTLRQNLVRIGPDQKAFFIGTGFHFALEDFHGYQKFDHPALAFAAYYDAQNPDDLPEEGAEEALELATGMLMYYADDWILEHPERGYDTLWIDGVPQVEVEVAVDITELLIVASKDHPFWMHYPGGFEAWLNGREVHYVTTYDRVLVDVHERIRGLDYKTAAQFDELNLATNPQAGAYDWSLDLFYRPLGYTVDGIVWQQHRKLVPIEPRVVNVGKKNEGLQMKSDMATTYRLYKRAVKERYGTIPEKYLGFLAMLGEAQDERGDRFVRRDILRRNQQQREIEQESIVDEVLEMLYPDMALYPNFTNDCKWDCAFRIPCLAKQDGSDFQYILNEEYAQWQGYKDDWRSRVVYPDAKSATMKGK